MIREHTGEKVETITQKQVAEQLQEIDKLIRRLGRGVDGDRVPLQLKASTTFKTDEFSPKEMTFNIPRDADFEGVSFNLFLSSRVLNQADSTSDERTFRPTDWDFNTSVQDASATQFVKAGGVFELRDSINGHFQNAPLAIAAAFSGRMSWCFSTATNSEIPAAEYPSGLVFPTGYELPRGSALTCRITPTTTNSNESAGYIREFRVTGILSGHKIAAGMRS